MGPIHTAEASDKTFMRRLLFGLFAETIVLAACCTSASAQQSEADLAAAAQNPVAAMYSLPFQNNVFGGAGPKHDAVGNVLNIQPVLPFTIGDWNMISRTIAPVIYVPGLTPGLSDNAGTPTGTSSVVGLGDISQTVYFSPAAASSGAWARRSRSPPRPAEKSARANLAWDRRLWPL